MSTRIGKEGAVATILALAILTLAPPASAQPSTATVYAESCPVNITNTTQGFCSLAAVPEGQPLVIESVSVSCEVAGGLVDLNETRLHIQADGLSHIFQIPIRRQGVGVQSNQLTASWVGTQSGPIFADASSTPSFAVVRFQGNPASAACSVTVMGRYVALPR
jgi:hypothetical protein